MLQLQELPLEILLKILHYVLFPVNCLGYYLERENEKLWNHLDGRSLSATCWALRVALTPSLWQKVSISIGNNLKEISLPTGYKLISSQDIYNSRPSLSSLTCAWRLDEEVATHYRHIIPSFGNHRFSTSNQLSPILFDSAFSYIKAFKIGFRDNDNSCCSSFSSSVSTANAQLKNYLFAISLVRPQIMPLLEYLDVHLFINKFTEEPHKKLGRVLWTFEKKIKLGLCKLHTDDWPDRFDLPLSDFIHSSGLFPFLDSLQNYMFNHRDMRNAADLTNLRKLTISYLDWDRVLKSNFEICGKLRMTHLNLIGVPTVPNAVVPVYHWIPPTVKIFSCCPNLARLPEDEEKQYRSFDNVTSFSLILGGIYPQSEKRKLYFRNLTQLHVGKLLHYENTAQLVRKLLQSNKNLVTLKIHRLQKREYNIIFNGAGFGQIENLEYVLYFDPWEYKNGFSYFCSAMTNWGPNLRKLSYEIDLSTLSFSAINPTPFYVDYLDFRRQVLDHPKLEFNAIQIKIRYSIGDIYQGPDFNSIEDILEDMIFYDSFKQSLDFEHFGYKDFCDYSDPSLFEPSWMKIDGEDVKVHKFLVFIDFVKLRTLIKKADESYRVND